MSELMEQHTAKILIVDDSLSDILVMQKSLAGLGEIYNAASGRQALEQLELIRPEIVLLDVEMPDFSGLEICQVIRDNPALKSTRVIFATVHEDDHTEYLSFKSGADDYLVKPFNMNICRFRVQNQIRLYNLIRQSLILLSMLNTLPFAVSAWQEQGQCLTANQPFLAAFNLSTADLPNQRLSQLMGEAIAERLWHQATIEERSFTVTPESGDIRYIEGFVELSLLSGSEKLLMLTLTSVDYQPCVAL